MINACAEILLTKKSFKGLLPKRRCVILADGFYEWKKAGTKTKNKEDKIAHFIHMKDDRVFAFAGLWESNRKVQDAVRLGHPIETCTIITTSPNELMKDLHDRMPAILSPARVEAWLDRKNEDG